MHSTSNLDDGYIGSGDRLRNSVRYHGKDKHSMEILEFLEDRESLRNKEKEIVNEEFLKDPMCMNLALGGKGGFEHIEAHKMLEGRRKGAKATHKIIWNDPEYIEKIKTTSRKSLNKLWEDPKMAKIMRSTFLGKSHTAETKMKMSLAKKGNCSGAKNSQYGTCWIYSDIKKVSKKIKNKELNTYLILGWTKGRKMKFI